MSDKALDKMKEQCLELVLNIVPFSQVGFVFIMSVVFSRMHLQHKTSTLDSLSGLGIGALMGPKEGLFWKVGVLVIGFSFILALINAFFIKASIRYSFRSSGISTKLTGWMEASSKAIKNLSPEERAPIRESINAELEKRMKKYLAKRMVSEALFSFGLIVFYGSCYIVFSAIGTKSLLHFSLAHCGLFVSAFFFGFLMHRASIRYAIAKIIPLQVYLSATTGEIAFFIDVD